MTDTVPRAERCRVCRAELAPEARFCGACGRATTAHRRAVIGRRRRSVNDTARAAFALGAIAAVVWIALLSGCGLDPEYDAASDLLAQTLVLGAGIVVGSLVLGREPTTDAAAAIGSRRRTWPWLLAAVPAAALTFAIAVGYVTALHGLLSIGRELQDPFDGTQPMRWVMLVGLVMVAPVGEEWLCRGVAWRAAHRLGGTRAAWLLSSLLFAFLHALGGLYLFELPHRFAGGLVFGALRAGSGRLAPAMLAHALHNVACTLLEI